MRIFKILSLLLAYPDLQLQEAAADITLLLRETTALPSNIAPRLAALAERIAKDDLLDTQELYVKLFDQTRSLSLYLFEHVHGESRDRGQAMVDLRTQYEDHGLEMQPGELPDFLPLFLEFLDVVGDNEARGLLDEISPIARSLAGRLAKRKSDYAAVFDAIIALAPQIAPDITSASPEDEPADVRDANWAESPVQFTASSIPIVPCAGGQS
ncbi:nitrate reductase molybdenum cofactor assembly chaperone [Acidiphilium sp.]|uniref:nitrate reductase molybdenum cofactor assembly chaperone n=1 Tax=Acidiphilium sp. TaxID=527 RepID=UPI003D002F74